MEEQAELIKYSAKTKSNFLMQPFVIKMLIKGKGMGTGSDAASEWADWVLAHPEFSSSVNPIPTKGGRLCPPHY